MGTFQERLAEAVEDGDVVTIERQEGRYYSVRVQRKTGTFGTLSQRLRILVEKATPGALVGAIEDISRGLSAAVETVEAAQTGQPDDAT